MRLLGLNVPFTTDKRSGFSVTDDRAFSPFPWFFGSSSSGETVVTPESALMFSAVFASVRVISETLASVPLLIYERKGDKGKDRAVNLPLYKVLRTKPNNQKTSGVEFRQMLMSHVLLWGNGYAQILRNKAGEVLELRPMHPAVVKPRVDDAGDIYYEIRTRSGVVKLPGNEVFHLRGYRDSGLEGMSPITAARQAIKMGLSLESFTTNFFDGGAFPAGVLEYEGGEMPQEARDNLRNSWQDFHGGANRGKKVAILEAGLKWKPMGIPQADAQFLEQRRFQIEEIARIYRVPPHMLGDLTRSTYSNIEQQSQEFVTYCLLPWFRMWEDAICRDFFDGDDRKYFAEFLVDALLRGDTLSRSQAYQVQIQSGMLSPNEARAFENRNPRDGGDEYMALNKEIPASQASAEPAADAPPDTAAPKKDATKEVKSAFKGPFKETWERIVRKEIGAVRSAAKKKTNEEFDVWFSNFLEEHRAFAESCLAEIFNSYAQLAEVDASVKAPVAKYIDEVRTAITAWQEDPSKGYERDEALLGSFLASRTLGYTEGEYAT